MRPGDQRQAAVIYQLRSCSRSTCTSWIQNRRYAPRHWYAQRTTSAKRTGLEMCQTPSGQLHDNAARLMWGRTNSQVPLHALL